MQGEFECFRCLNHGSTFTNLMSCSSSPFILGIQESHSPTEPVTTYRMILHPKRITKHFINSRFISHLSVMEMQITTHCAKADHCSLEVGQAGLCIQSILEGLPWRKEVEFCLVLS